MLTSTALATAVDNAFEHACRVKFTVVTKERVNPGDPARIVWFRGNTWFSDRQSRSRGFANFQLGDTPLTLEVHDEDGLVFFRPAAGEFPEFESKTESRWAIAGRLESVLAMLHRSPRELAPAISDEAFESEQGAELLADVAVSHCIVEDFRIEENPTGENGPIDMALVKTTHHIWIDKNETLRRVKSSVLYESAERPFRAHQVDLDLAPAGRDLMIPSIITEPLRGGDYDLQSYYCEQIGVDPGDLDFGLDPPEFGV